MSKLTGLPKSKIKVSTKPVNQSEKQSDPFTEEERRYLGEQYDQDIARIRSGFAGAKWIGAVH